MGDDQHMLADGFLVVGHRGAAGRAAENTLSSFRYAWKAGVRAVELDVQQVEGELVVIHDETLDRTTNASGKLRDYSLSQLRTLDAGGGDQIPLLREVLAAAPEFSLVNVELKGSGTGALVAAEVEHWPGIEFVVSSFDHGELAIFDGLQAGAATAVGIAPLFHYWRAVLTRAERFRERGVSVNISDAIATQRHIEALRAADWDVWVYTVNDPERATQLRGWGVRGVFSDVPDALLFLEH